MKNKPIDKIVLTVVVLLIVCVAVLNICQKERPTVSVTENRNLATMPEFSLETLLSGEYFADISAFISDTFVGRDALVEISKKIDAFKSLSLIHEREGISVIVDPNPGKEKGPEEMTLPTFPPVTTAPPETTVAPTEESTVPTTEAPVIPIFLSETEISFQADGSYVLAVVIGEGYGDLRWDVASEAGLAITDNGDGTVTITADGAGSAMITATVTGNGETCSAQCQITVKAVAIQKPAMEPADFLPNGMIIYNGAAHSQSYFSKDCAVAFAKLYDLYAQLFPESRMSAVIAPLSTITITDPEVSQYISDQGSILDQLEAEVFGNVNFVNLKNVYLEHADEYLYYRSDHHWTHRGAYYAYSEFAKSVGFTPTPIYAFEKKILTENYLGSLYNYSGDSRVATFLDTVEAYMPTKACNMKIYYGNGGVVQRDNCILPEIPNYLAFIGGDNGYTVINVPENPQDRNILVVKDSFGNAFVTYLAEHYGNIVVIDPRYADVNIYDFYNTYKFTDIVFMANSTSGNMPIWHNYLASLLN